MGQARGSRTKVRIGVETTLKTAPAAGYQIPFKSCSMSPDRAKKESAVLNGTGLPTEPFDGFLKIPGGLAVPVDSEMCWHLLQLAFGDPVTTGAESPWTHTFKLGNTRPTFTLETEFTDLDGTLKYFRYVGCKIGKISSKWFGDEELFFDFDIVAADYSIETTSFHEAAPVLTQTKLKSTHFSITEDSASMTNCTGFDFTVDFALDTDNYVAGGGGALGEIPDGIPSVSGNLNALFESVDLLQKAVNSTESSIVGTLANGASSIMAATIPELQYSPKVPPIDGPKGIRQALSFIGYYSDATEATAFQIELTNTAEHA